MVTTNSTVTVRKVLGAGKTTDYTVDNVSLFLKNKNGTKRFNPTSVTNSSATVVGLLVFEVPLPELGSYTVKVSAENDSDLDVSGVQINVLATGFIQKIANESVLEM